MLQIGLPFAPRKSAMKSLSYREHLLNLLKGDLDFHGHKSSAVHTWHAFPAKFPPRLPQIFIAELTRPGDIVFDPMMGSCTTLLEAVMSGRRAVGTDIDPLSLRLGQVRLNTSDIADAKDAGYELTRKAEKRLSQDKDDLERALEKRFDPETRKFVDYWFTYNTQLELAALITEIEKLGNSIQRRFFTLVFSAIIITKSGGVSLARDLAHTRPHRVKEKIPRPAIPEFRKRLQLNLNRLIWRPQSDSVIMEADSRQLPLSDNSVDLIVTSPPYAANAIDYMRAHKFSLVWLGYSVSHLGKLRRKYIGGEAVSGADLSRLPGYPTHIVAELTALDRKKGRAIHRYYSEMNITLSEMYRVLRAGRAAIVVVGTSVIRGMNTEIQKCLKEIGEYQGFDLIHTGIRRLDRNKRMMPARWNSKKNTGIEARMHEEYVIGFLKPER